VAARAAAVSAAILERKAEANLRAEVESAEAERAKTLTPERVELEADGDWCARVVDGLWGGDGGAL
jgi:uncharacterized membrane protein